MGMAHPAHVNLNWVFAVKKADKEVQMFLEKGDKADIKARCK